MPIRLPEGMMMGLSLSPCKEHNAGSAPSTPTSTASPKRQSARVAKMLRGTQPSTDENGSYDQPESDDDQVPESSSTRRRGNTGEVIAQDEEHMTSPSRMQRRSPSPASAAELLARSGVPLRDPRVIALRATANAESEVPAESHPRRSSGLSGLPRAASPPRAAGSSSHATRHSIRKASRLSEAVSGGTRSSSPACQMMDMS